MKNIIFMLFASKGRFFFVVKTDGQVVDGSITGES